MENDDRQVGSILTRREMLALLAGMGGAALLAACDTLGSSTAQPAAIPTQTSAASGAPASVATQTPLNAEAATAAAATPVQASPTADTAAAPACVVRPELTEGPYFVDEKLNRSDIRSDPSDGSVKQGVPLHLVFRVSRLDGISCAAFPGVTVDVWHCDAQGVYSDVQDPSFNTKGKKYLRGYQN